MRERARQRRVWRRQHFELIAEVIFNLPLPSDVVSQKAQRVLIASDFATALKEKNDGFDEGRFIRLAVYGRGGDEK